MRTTEKKHLMDRSLVLLLSGVFCLFTLPVEHVSAQNTAVHSASGIEFQLYPTGYIGTARLTYPMLEKLTITFHVGFNVTDRRDLGEHDEETGSGIGVGAALRYFFKGEGSGLHAGVRSDLWFMDMTWQENSGLFGLTDIVIFQPTAQLGYTIVPKNSQLLFDATIAFGMEINIQTQGSPVGEGPVLLGALGASYRFR